MRQNASGTSAFFLRAAPHALSFKCTGFILSYRRLYNLCAESVGRACAGKSLAFTQLADISTKILCQNNVKPLGEWHFVIVYSVHVSMCSCSYSIDFKNCNYMNILRSFLLFWIYWHYFILVICIRRSVEDWTFFKKILTISEQLDTMH